MTLLFQAPFFVSVFTFQWISFLSVKIIFIYISAFSKLWRIYIPIGRIAGICYLYGIAGIQFSDLIGSVIGFGASQGKITLAYTDCFCNCSWWRRASCQIILVYKSVFAMLRRIYIPVGRIAGIDQLYCIPGIQLSDLIGWIIGFCISQGKIAFTYTCLLYTSDAADEL